MENKSGSISNILKIVIVLGLIIVSTLVGREIAVLADDTTPTPTPTVSGVAISTAGLGATKLVFTEEELVVDSTKQVYYCVIKKQGVTDVKASELIKAAAKDSSSYLIDFSVYAGTKDVYIGLATTDKPGTNGMVTTKVVTIPATDRKIQFNMNWGIEGSDAKQNKLIREVIITASDSKTYIYKANPKGDEKNINDLTIQFKKGSNGDWTSITNLSNGKWESMKASGAVFYLRLAPDDVKGKRCSKEFKVKCNITKAPAAKVDPNKLTLSVKNGIQFRMEGETKWNTILPYSSGAASGSAIRSNKLSTQFDPSVEGTKTKITNMSLDDIFKLIGTKLPTDGSVITVPLEIRIAATISKPASRIGLVELSSQMDAPSVNLIYDKDAYKVSLINKATTDKISNPTFECVLASNTDIKSGKFDITTAKWAAVRLGSEIKPTFKNTYTLLTGERKTVVITDKDAVLLFRRHSGNINKATVIASKYVAVSIPAKSAATTTPAPTVTPTVAVTTTPTPAL